MSKNTGNDIWTSITSIGSFLFFALMLSIPSGYSYGAALLLVSSIVFLSLEFRWFIRSGKLRARGVLLEGAALTRRRFLPLGTEDKAIMYTLLAIFMIALLMFFLHGNEPNSLDASSRCLLAIPILMLLLKAPPRLGYMWAGLVVGTLAAAGVAAWQVHITGIARATGFVTSAVPFGNEGLMMGVLCAAGLFWANTQGRYARYWRIALLLGVAAGMYCSEASGTRGGWVAIAPVFVLFCIAFLNIKNVPKVSTAIAIVVVVAGAVFGIPNDSSVELRYDEALQEIDDYVLKREATSSIGGRLEAWRAAAISIPQKPLLGWSHEEYRVELNKLVAEKRLDPFVLTLVNTHNNYLELWLFQGLPGLLALLTLYVLGFWLFCKRLRAPDVTVRVLAVCGASLIACFFTFGLTHVILGRNNGIIFFVLSLTILWGSLRKAEATDLRSD